MEKQVIIDGKKITLKSKGSTALIYSGQFHSDFFSDLLKLSRMMPTTKKNKIKQMDEWTEKDIEKIDFMPLYNFVWATAKTADRTIEEPLDWLDKFDEFPIIEIMPEIQDLMINSVQGKKGLKTSTKAMKR